MAIYRSDIPKTAKFFMLTREQGGTTLCTDLLKSNRHGDDDRDQHVGQRFCWKAARMADVHEGGAEDYADLEIYDASQRHLMTIALSEQGFQKLVNEMNVHLDPNKDRPANVDL